MATYFTSPNRVRENGYVDNNVSDKDIITAITVAQETKLQQLWGYDNYSYYLDGLRDDTLTEDEKAFLIEKVIPLMNWYTVYQLLEMKKLSITNSSISTGSTTGTSTLSYEDVTEAINEVNGIIKAYETLLVGDDNVRSGVIFDYRDLSSVDSDSIPVTSPTEKKYLLRSELGQADGVASLDSSAKIPLSQSPAISQKRQADGIAPLDSYSEVPYEFSNKREVRVAYVTSLPPYASADKDVVYSYDGKMWEAHNGEFIDVTSYSSNRYQIARLMIKFNIDDVMIRKIVDTITANITNDSYNQENSKNITSYNIIDASGNVAENILLSTDGEGTISRRLTINKGGNSASLEFGLKSDGSVYLISSDNKTLTSNDFTDESKQNLDDLHENLGETEVVQETGTSTTDVISQDAITKLLTPVQSAYPYPVTTPERLGQDLIDSKKRFYKAAGTSSLNDWDIGRNEGFTGVNTGNVNLYAPNQINDRTFEMWIEGDKTAQPNASFLNLRNSDSVSSNRLFLYNYSPTTGRYLLVAQHNNVTLFSKTFYEGQKAHVVFSYFENKLSVWANGVLLLNEEDYSDHPLNEWFAFLKYSRLFKSSEYNFKPTNAQVREWYNTGRVDRYELPNYYKYSNSIDYNYFNELDTQEKVNKINYLIRCTKELDTVDSSLKLTGTTSGDNVPFGTYLEPMIVGELYEISFLIKSTNTTQYPGFQQGTGIKLYEERSQLSSSYKQYKVIFIASRTVPIGIYAATSGGIVGATYNIKNLRVKRISCLHEYLGRNIQPHKLKDTGAIPEDKSLIDGTTRTAEPTREVPYQEYISGDGAPTIIPQIEQQSYEDLTSKNLYKSVGTESVTDWERINN